MKIVSWFVKYLSMNTSSGGPMWSSDDLSALAGLFQECRRSWHLETWEFEQHVWANMGSKNMRSASPIIQLLSNRVSVWFLWFYPISVWENRMESHGLSMGLQRWSKGGGGIVWHFPAAAESFSVIGWSSFSMILSNVSTCRCHFVGRFSIDLGVLWEYPGSQLANLQDRQGNP